MRYFLSLFRLTVALLAAVLLLANSDAGLCQTPPAATAAAPAPAPIGADDLQSLIDTLQNQPERDKLVEQLRALIAAQRAAQPAAQAAEPPPTFLAMLSDQLRTISTDILTTATVAIDVPYLVRWIEAEADDATARARWGQVLLHLAIVFGLAAAAEFALRWLLARPLTAL